PARFLSDRYGLDALDTFTPDPAAVRERFDAPYPRRIDGRAVGCVYVASEFEAPRRADLDQEQHHRAGARRRYLAKLDEVLGPALGHRIGKFRQPWLAHEVHVLDLDVARRPRQALEQEIDAGILAVPHLAAEQGIAAELGDGARGDRLGCQRVGVRRVDAHEFGAATEVNLDQFPTVGELAFGICGHRQPHAGARRVEPDHRSRIGAVHRHRL